MLANNNVSAGRVITKMQFDINYPVPRLLFSPAAAVPDSMYEVIKQQGKTKGAENAVKLTVYKSDKTEEEVEAPAQPETVSSTDAVEAPIKRETARKVTTETADDVSDIVKKWAKK
jgi:hypothetical protein